MLSYMHDNMKCTFRACISENLIRTEVKKNIRSNIEQKRKNKFKHSELQLFH